MNSLFRCCFSVGTVLLFTMTPFRATGYETPPIPLWETPDSSAGDAGGENVPSVTPFVPEPALSNGAAMLVFPGGGYAGLAPHEGKPVAEWLNTLGITAFVVRYRHAPHFHHPVPLEDAARAVRLVRSRAREWKIDPNRVGVLGFSAGGHLAATIGTHFDEGDPDASDPVERFSSRPDLLVLCYPVITMGEWTHAGSRFNLLGEHPEPEQIQNLSNEKQVSERTPPTFLFHTADDPAVDSRNSLLFARALRDAGVDFELHLYEHGRHGVGLAEQDPILQSWTRRCAAWLSRHGFASPRIAPPEPLAPVPSKPQLQWQEAELLLFLHFGMNTFTGKEWGDGTEDPDLFNPTGQAADQWVRVAKETGFKWIILTAKHHDGFCLWPTKETDHSVRSSLWKDGKGDVVKEVADACRREGLRFGVYLSPWDRHEPSYADNRVYDQFYRAQLTELLTGYGPISEVWLDGAGGKGHVYDFESYYALIRELQPDAVIAICGPDVRWVGNEDGVARETEWSVQPANPAFHPGVQGEVWYPAECDTSIRPRWFWHPEDDEKVKSLSELMDIYYKSVGRNSNLLLNVPPNDKGLLPEPDVRRLREFRRARDEVFSVDFALGKPASADNVRGGDLRYGPGKAVDLDPSTYWATDDEVRTASLEVDLLTPKRFNVIRIEEFIQLGQRVEGYRVEGCVENRWVVLCRGTTIGHKKLDRTPTVSADRVRLIIEKTRACPTIRSFGLHYDPLIETSDTTRQETKTAQ